MHKPVYLVNPIFEVIFGFFFVCGLSATTREAVRAMKRAGYVNEVELEHENRDDPAIDACRRCDVGVREHAFDILRVYFDDEIAKSKEVDFEGSECAI
jgi:hypothetical protein